MTPDRVPAALCRCAIAGGADDDVGTTAGTMSSTSDSPCFVSSGNRQAASVVNHTLQVSNGSRGNCSYNHDALWKEHSNRHVDEVSASRLSWGWPFTACTVAATSVSMPSRCC